MSSEEITEKFAEAEERFEKNCKRLKTMLMTGSPEEILTLNFMLFKKIGEDLHFYSKSFEDIQLGLSTFNIDKILNKATEDAEIDEMNSQLELFINDIILESFYEAKTIFPEVNEVRLLELVEFIINKNF